MPVEWMARSGLVVGGELADGSGRVEGRRCLYAWVNNLMIFNEMFDHAEGDIEWTCPEKSFRKWVKCAKQYE